MDNNNNFADYGRDEKQVENGLAPKDREASSNFNAAARRGRNVNWVGVAIMMILVGAVLAGGAWLSGARGGSLGWDGRPVFFVNPIGSDEAQSVNISPQNIRELQIISSSARVTIRTNRNSNDFVIEFVGLPLNYDVAGGRLAVDARPAQVLTGFNLFGGFGGYAVNVYVPAGLALDVSVRSSSGRVDIRHPSFAMLDVKASSGRIELERAEILGDINLTTSSGRISAENVTAQTGRFTSSSGRIEVSDGHFGNLYVNSSSGRQEIEDSSWNNLTASSSSGRVEIDDARILSAVGSTSISASSGRVSLTVVGRESDFNYSLRSNSGSIRVNGARRDTRNIGNAHDINIRTTSGSIRLDFD